MQVYAQKETCSEETSVEKLVEKGLERILLHPQATSPNGAPRTPKLKLIWGSTLYHLRDLPFTPGSLPDVYTQFRKVGVPKYHSFSPYCPLLVAVPSISSTQENG